MSEPIYDCLDMNLASCEERVRILEAALKHIAKSMDALLGCGRKDHSSDKYDGYFEDAKESLARARWALAPAIGKVKPGEVGK